MDVFADEDPESHDLDRFLEMKGKNDQYLIGSTTFVR